MAMVAHKPLSLVSEGEFHWRAFQQRVCTSIIRWHAQKWLTKVKFLLRRNYAVKKYLGYVNRMEDARQRRAEDNKRVLTEVGDILS